MISGILAILASPIFGSAFGLLGSFLSKREDRLNKELDQKHEREMATLTHTQKIEYRQVDADANVNEQDALSFTKAVEGSSVNSGSKIADSLKSAIRPILTAYLVVVLSYVAYQVSTILGGITAIPLTDLIATYIRLIATVEFLTSTAVLFWFGIRPTQKRIQS